jgi:hypothetical protein
MSDRRRLVLLSALMLFVELALIRWAGSNVVYLSYFSNFVLLGSFLGIGIGFLRAEAARNWFAAAPVALAALVAFIRLFPVTINRSGADLIYFGDSRVSGLPTWVTLPLIFVAVAAVLAMIAQGVARTFAKFEALEAYRLDIGGSILGIVAFSLVSFLQAPPVVWGLVAAVAFWVLSNRRLPVPSVVALAVVVVLLGIESLEAGQSWSPYYKVTTTERGEGDDVSTLVDVNGIPHQEIQTIERRASSTAT